MHFANDALWWRLRHPTVRELAALIFAPELWLMPHHLPPHALIGDTGLRQLLHWNDHPNDSLRRLETADPITLLRFWLTHAPHSQLLEQHQSHFRIRLTHDRQAHEHSLILHHHSHATIATPPPNSNGHNIITRGIVFLPPNQLPEPPFHTQAWHGTLLTTWQQLPHEHAHYHILPDPAPLAPIVRSNTISRDAILRQTPPTLIARMVQRPDGLWHETERFYCPTATT